MFHTTKQYFMDEFYDLGIPMTCETFMLMGMNSIELIFQKESI